MKLTQATIFIALLTVTAAMVIIFVAAYLIKMFMGYLSKRRTIRRYYTVYRERKRRRG